jgi:hypothetical protein
VKLLAVTREGLAVLARLGMIPRNRQYLTAYSGFVKPCGPGKLADNAPRINGAREIVEDRGKMIAERLT